MAKDRDGSINIYGSLQAKTEDGIVAYTDGIAHENEDGTKTPLDQLLKDSGGIIDVDKFPQSGWSGTPIPVDGVTPVTSIYLNNQLSIEETVSILDKMANGQDGQHFILADTNETFILALMKQGQAYVLINLIDNNIYFASEDVDNEFGFIGWNPNITYPLSVNFIVTYMEIEGGSVNLLDYTPYTSLISTTPIVLEQGNINDKAIYRLKESSENLPVPVDGVTVVEKAYFNTSLSKEEVVEELQKLTLYELYGLAGKWAFLFVCNEPVLGFFVYYDENIWTIQNGSFEEIFSSETGWNVNFVSPMELNVVSETSNAEIPVGQENDKITNLISINPFGGSTKYTYWVYKDKWVKLLTSEDGSLVPSIPDNLPYTDIMDLGTLTQEQYEGRANITITSEQFNKLKEGKTIIKVNFELSDTLPSINTIYLPLNDKTTLSLGETSIDVYVFSTNVNNNTSSYGYGISINGQANEDGTYTASFYFTEFTEFNPSYLFLEYYGTELQIRYQTTSSAIQIDQTPTENSEKLISSGGVFNALQNVGGSAIVDVDVLPEEPKSDVIYRIQSTDTYKEGTLLVSNPQTTVNTIYFNNDLSILKTDEILSSLTYTNFNGVNVNVLYTNATATSVVFAFKSSKGNRYYIAYTTNIADTSTAELIFSSSDGWQKTEKYINSSGVSELMGLTIGNENNKLTQILSMNNDFVIKNYYNYWVYKNKWLQLIQNYTLEEEKGLKIIHVGDVELTDKDSTKFIYYGNLSINRNLFDKIVYDFNKVILVANLKKIDALITEVYPTCFYPSNPDGIYYVTDNGSHYFRYYTFSSCNKIYIKSFDGSSRNQSNLLMFTAVAQYDGGNDECFITFSLSIINEFSENNFSKNIGDNGIEITYGDSYIIDIPYDRVPQENSNYILPSGAVHTALQEKQDKITVTENADGTVDITIPTE